MTALTDIARDGFDASSDFTVGIEEEFALLDDALELVPRFDELRDAAAGDDVLRTAISGELIASEIEIRSGRGETFADAVLAQREHRRRLFALAARLGVGLGSTGTHPWADYRRQRFIDTDHYRRVAESLQWVARRNNTFALHVHVGVRGADRAVRVCDRMRAVLPQLLAVSANSPFLDGCDAGLHSGRTQIFTRMFPRCGIPDAHGSWDSWSRYVDFLFATNSIVEYTQVWWSVRPHFSFGTVEVRICDAQTTAAESEGLAALVVACVAQAARDEDEGRPLRELPSSLLGENLWRAARHGLEGRLIDFERAREYPSADVVERLARWTAPVRAELGLDVALPELNGAQRQRRMIEAGMAMDEVYAACVRDTRVSYAEEVRV